jgi:hypothetical protein
MPEMAGVLRTRAAEETSALAPAAGASFSSRPASQRLDCGRGRTRIQNFISVSVVRDLFTQIRRSSTMRFRRTRAVIVSREAAKQTKGANGAAPSGRARSKHDREAKGARRAWIATSP